MATAADVRAWGRDNGRPTGRGKLPASLTDAWDAAHPSDLYQPGPPREANGHDPDYPADDFDAMFPDVDTPSTADETPPRRPVAKTGKAGIAGLFTRKPAGKAKRKVPRVSTENLLGGIWRGAAKLATPLPPLQRTLRMQAPVAGMLLDDTVKDTFIDPMLQPLARIAAKGKEMQALAGPPMFVTAITAHVAQRAALDPPQDPHPLFMAIASEGLRSSLMAWMEVAGPKFEIALQHEQEFEAKYGQSVDAMMAFIFSAPPDPRDTEAMMAEEEAIRRAQGMA